MTALIRLLALCLALAPLAPAAASAQASVGFSGLRQDTSLPVEISADRLEVDQNTGRAVFSGNVLIGQGEMRLSADEVTVEYGEEGQAGGEIRRLLAEGGVTLVNGGEAAEAGSAEYTIATGQVVMTEDVVLTQGRNALSGQKLTINLQDGTGTMEGRVRSVLRPGSQ